MDIATIVGLFAGFFLLLLSCNFNIAPFVDLPSVYITVGGTVSAVFTAFPVHRIFMTFGVVKNSFIAQKQTPVEIIKQLVEFAEQARREGILALEARAIEIKDSFLKKGIQLAVDGTEPELIKDILSTEIAFIETRHGDGVKIIDLAGYMGPAFGMLGTLIGLVLMLGNLNDVESIGPNMAIALITSLYGSIIANVICIPLAEKLRGYSAQEIMIKELMLEGIMSLQSGDNPRIVEQKLTAFIAPSLRASAMKLKSGAG